MTPQEINIAIAKVRRWEKLYKGPEPDNRWISPKGEYRTDRDIPNYYGDLNAMHEAEKVLSDTQMDDYAGRLHKMAPHRPHYTAAQRAEAFLRTLNLWK